ncbi:hypothetical protein Tco_1474661 [Tanacetum coccineum]
MLLDMARLIKANRTLLNSNIFPHEDMSMRVLLAKERILKLIQVWDEEQIKPWSLPELLLQLSNDSQTIAEILKQRDEKHIERKQAANLAVQKEQEEQAAQSFTPYWDFPMIDDDDDDEHTIQYRLYLERSSKAITPDLPTEEPDNSLSMGDEHLSTILEMESDKLIKSSVENLSDLMESLLNRDTPIVYSPKIDSLLEEFAGELAPINPIPPRIHEADFDPKEDIRLDDQMFYDYTSSDDDSFEDIDYVEASPPDSELVSIEEVEDDILRAKLSNIYLLIAKIKSLNDNPTPSFLSHSDNSLPEFKTFSNHTEETRSGSTTTHAENSLPEYDSFHFEIESNQGELSRAVMETIDEIDAFLDIDVSTGLEDGYHDSEGDIIYLESLLINNTIPNLSPEYGGVWYRILRKGQIKDKNGQSRAREWKEDEKIEAEDIPILHGPTRVHLMGRIKLEKANFIPVLSKGLRLLKELTTSKAPEKVLIKEEAKSLITKSVNSISLIREEEGKNDIYDVATGDDSKETDEADMEVSVKEVETKNRAESGAKNKPIKKPEKEEVVEAPSLSLFNDSLSEARARKKKGKTYNVLLMGPDYEAIIKKKITKKRTWMKLEKPCSNEASNIPGDSDDVLVEIAEHVYPMYFVILDIKEDEKRPFILGTTPFLTTAKAREYSLTKRG